MLVDVDYEETEGKLKQYDDTDLDYDDDFNLKNWRKCNGLLLQRISYTLIYV
jgi:hypothetical protein